MIDTVIIDPGTGGLSSQYLSAYLESSLGKRIIAIGNYWALDSRIIKLFFRYSDLSSTNRIQQNFIRLIVRYLELAVGLAGSMSLIRAIKPKRVIYALSLSKEFLPEILFAIILRYWLRVEIILLGHDIVPFGRRCFGWYFRVLKRKFIFKMSSKVIIHNRTGYRYLTGLFNISVEKIIYIPFPIMQVIDEKEHTTREELADIYSKMTNAKRSFLLIGHYRAEKGFELLVEAWKIMQLQSKQNYLLVIAGQGIPNSTINQCRGAGILTYNHYIDDLEYCELLKRSDFVVLPYLTGTNCGPLSNALSISKPVICTPIPMFINSGLIGDLGISKSTDPSSLSEVLIGASTITDHDYQMWVREQTKLRNIRLYEFSESLENLL